MNMRCFIPWNQDALTRFSRILLTSSGRFHISHANFIEWKHEGNQKKAANIIKYRDYIDEDRSTPPDAISKKQDSSTDSNFVFASDSLFSPSDTQGIKGLDDATQRRLLSIKGFTPFHEFPTGVIEKLFSHCPLRISLLPFQQQGVGWMVRKELTGTGGILADHLGLGKTIQMIALILLNPLKIMKTDRLFVSQIVEAAGSVHVSRMHRMAAVCRLLYKLPGIGDCSRLLQPEMNLFELAIYIEDRIQEQIKNDVELESMTKHCQSRLDPWLAYARKFYSNYEKKCRMFINSSDGIDSCDPDENNEFETPELRTLLVVPTSILHQWKGELQRHISTDRSFSIHTYHSSGEGRMQAEKLEQYDFVLTTYDVLMRDALPYIEKLEHDESNFTKYKGNISREMQQHMKEDTETGNEMVFERKKCGPLFSVLWKRVVLDEAHMVRNPSTKRWKAVNQLLAMKRWCITATPMQNDIRDLQNLLKFIRSPPLPLPSGLDAHRLLNDKELQEAVARSLRDVVLRREPVMTRYVAHPDKTDSKGDPLLMKQKVSLLKLPPKIEHIELITATPSEVKIYNDLVARTRRLANLKAKEIHSRTIFFITLLCRLRQLCCHPWLVESVNLSEGEVFCEECKSIAEDPVKMTCGHVFCYQCLLNSFDEAEERLKSSPVDNLSSDLAFKNDRDRADTSTQTYFTHVDNGEEDKVKHIKCSQDQCEGFVTRSNLKRCLTRNEQRVRYRERPFVSSSKIETCLDILRNIEKKSPGDKVVIFTHFVTFINILEIALENAGISYLRLDGTMRSHERAGAIAAFQEDTKIRILMASKVACGVGLNLTMANHCIVLDPWWNPGIEEQAVHRCHRIGQTKPVHIYRCLIDKSIEYMCWQIANKKKIIGDMVIRSTMVGSESGFPDEQKMKFPDNSHAKKFRKKGRKGVKSEKNEDEKSTSGTSIQGILIQSLGFQSSN